MKNSQTIKPRLERRRGRRLWERRRPLSRVIESWPVNLGSRSVTCATSERSATPLARNETHTLSLMSARGLILEPADENRPCEGRQGSRQIIFGLRDGSSPTYSVSVCAPLEAFVAPDASCFR